MHLRTRAAQGQAAQGDELPSDAMGTVSGKKQWEAQAKFKMSLFLKHEMVGGVFLGA